MSRHRPSASAPGRRGDPILALRLAREIDREVLFDPASRGRYATDASIYRIEPIGVAVPRTEADVARIVEVTSESGTPLLTRGGGTSQCGQTVGEALVVDFSKYVNGILDLDVERRRVTVQPGLVLDRLNRALRPLPSWPRDPFRPVAELGVAAPPCGEPSGRPSVEVVLFADTFTRRFEPGVPRSAARVLRSAGRRVRTAEARGRPLCCGRTFLANGLPRQARAKARRAVAALPPFAEHGTQIIGVEPSSLYTFHDETPALLPGPESRRVARQAMLLGEWLAREREHGAQRLPRHPIRARRMRVHAHCHRRAFGTAGAAKDALGPIPGVEIEEIESSCWGMAGVFGHEAGHFDISMRMAELTLLPAVRNASPDTRIVAGGTNCRRQIADGAARRAFHPAEVPDEALGG